MAVQLVLKPFVSCREWSDTAILKSADVWLQVKEDVFPDRILANPSRLLITSILGDLLPRQPVCERLNCSAVWALNGCTIAQVNTLKVHIWQFGYTTTHLATLIKIADK